MVTDSFVIITTDGTAGRVYALTRSEGKLVWQYDVTEETGLGVGVTTDLILLGESVFGVTTGDRLIRLDLTTGELIWEFQSPFDPELSYWNIAPAARDTVVFFAGINGWVYCLHLQTGKVLWKTDIGARPTTSLILVEDDLYIGAADSLLYRLSGDDGEIINSLKLKGSPIYRLNMHNSALYVFIYDDPEYSDVTNLLAVNADLSEIIWELPASNEISWSVKKPYRYRDWIVTGSINGAVFLLDPVSGNVNESFGIDGTIRSMGFDDDVIYIGTQEGTVHAVRVKQ